MDIANIKKVFQNTDFHHQIKLRFGKFKSFVPDSIQQLRASAKSVIYKLDISTEFGIQPIIFKRYIGSKNRNTVEINLYEKALPFLKEFMPTIYATKSNIFDNETWMLIEYIEPLRGRIPPPNHFDYIIPTIAKLHAHSYEQNFYDNIDLFNPWFPTFHSKKMKTRRQAKIQKTKLYLIDALHHKRLKKMIEPTHSMIQQILSESSLSFSELVKNGQCIVHGDLHLQNICCNHFHQNTNNHIQMIDWESSRFASGWFDINLLVERYLGLRNSEKNNDDSIRNHCVQLYTKEMNKRGISFQGDPMILYKMSYLQYVLETGLLVQLQKEFDGNKGVLLTYYLDKVLIWGKELNLYS
ncbi:oxidoreductase family protein [Cytobacillus sp. IB215316]|uniref:oxidoreductase family protein n=1 Tax=Cytobacillus sp. IB215316 TaxID=3097354 RepID=UPI002A15090D|nr:oxidoreductase family protein [Cytobacillus sp. IB215316]MDX8361357.1 oxidoreductase family protein [Cytobacillus sp. IB215316]